MQISSWTYLYPYSFFGPKTTILYIYIYIYIYIYNIKRNIYKVSAYEAKFVSMPLSQILTVRLKTKIFTYKLYMYFLFFSIFMFLRKFV